MSALDELEARETRPATPLDGDAEGLPATNPPRPWRTLALELSLILAGGLLGTLVRFAISAVLGPQWDHGFPWDIALINSLGSLLIGFLAGWRDPASRTHELIWLAGATGFLGAFTTFSSFALGAIQLALAGQTLAGVAYLAGSVALGLLLVEAGLTLGERVRRG